jgi:hypothetical protein
MPVLASVPSAYAESVSFWSKDLDANVSMPWNGAAIPAPPGAEIRPTELGPDGLARWQGPPPQWLVTPPDDPRVQFAGRVAGRAPSGMFEAVELTGAPTAAWTATGIDAAGGVPAGQSATLTLARGEAPEVRDVGLTLSSPVGGSGPVRWRVLRDGRTLARGSIDAGAMDTAALRVPRCTAGDTCPPFDWELRVRGEGVLRLDAARLGS